MKEVLRTNDPVLLSFAQALLRDAGIESAVVDENMSAMAGSLGALPRRLVVDEEDHPRAERVIAEAGLENTA